MITIQSKYSIGEEVWTMSMNKIIRAKIMSLDLGFGSGSAEERLQWRLDKSEPGHYGYGFPVLRPEDQLFSTKEELIKHLIKQAEHD